MDRSIQIDTFCKFIQVSRETITSLKKYEDLLVKANKNLNLVGNSTINQIWSRHFLDSAQVIDFVDKKNKILGVTTPQGVLKIMASAGLNKSTNKSNNLKNSHRMAS